MTKTAWLIGAGFSYELGMPLVWDLTRELYVYGASSDFVGVAPIRARAGEVRTLTFTFDANLTRGLYAVEVNVVDMDRHRFMGVARGISVPAAFPPSECSRCTRAARTRSTCWCQARSSS